MSKVQYAESLVPLSMAMFILQIRWEEQDEGEKKQKKTDWMVTWPEVPKLSTIL